MKYYVRMKTELGATAVEYAIMVSLIAVVIITAVGLVGGQTQRLFEFVVGELGKAIS